MLQRRGHLSGPGAPHHDGSVSGAAQQEAAAPAEAAAVNTVAMTRERGERKLREVGFAIKTNRLIAGGGGQEGWREGTAAHLVCVMSKRGY